MASQRGWRHLIIGLLLFSIAFGYLEAAVVVYLRAIYEPLRVHLYPGIQATDLFPLITVDQLRSLGPEHLVRLKIELGREISTVAMLASVAFLVARTFREWSAAFVLCFGLWDVVFYVSLKLLLDWPASVLTWDILFLLPVPWIGPVIAPVLVSVSMIGAGFAVLWRENTGKPVFITGWRWTAIAIGGVIVVLAFIWDFRNTMQGGVPHAFNWRLFFTGELIGLLAFVTALRSAP